jgi:23S rRNA (guanosine2251-2'-O)-methyltransferase
MAAKPPRKRTGKPTRGAPRRAPAAAAPRQNRKEPASSRPREAREARARRGEDWIYGRHVVAAALANPARSLERLVLTRDGEDALAKDGVQPRIRPEIRSNQEISALLPEGAVHQGFALKAAPLAEKHIETVIAELAEGAPATVVVLDQVTDPRNVGAILRSAAAFGAAAVILPERHGADTTAALAKAASGALESVALVRVTNIARALETLKNAGFWTVGLAARAGETLASVDLTGRIALVLGAEGSGLRRLVAETCDIRARLPISDAMESLNVAAAAACALYEVARRRP